MFFSLKQARVVQRIECVPTKDEVVGSNPTSGVKILSEAKYLVGFLTKFKNYLIGFNEQVHEFSVVQFEWACEHSYLGRKDIEQSKFCVIYYDEKAKKAVKDMKESVTRLQEGR